MTEETALSHRSHGALPGVDLEAELGRQEGHDRGHDPLTRRDGRNVDVAVVRIMPKACFQHDATEAVAPPFQLFVEVVEKKIGEQCR